MALIIGLLNQFGYIILYLSLTLELMAVPLPGETLMIYCGFQVFKGNLNYLATIIVATAGIITGITTSYFVGLNLGQTFFHKYGPKLHIGPEKLDKISKWFNKYGAKLLIVTCFIPGVRHVIGYFSGITKIPYRKFALNAYIGAFIWSGSIISLGNVLGSKWHKFHGYITKYLFIVSILIVLILVCIYFVKNHKQRIINAANISLDYLFNILNSLGKVKVMVVSAAIMFIALFALFVGLIQHLLANQFGRFDMIMGYIIKRIFNDSWTSIFNKTYFLTSYPMVIVIFILLLGWIIIKGKNKFLEIKYLLITLCGGEILEEMLRYGFNRIGAVVEPITKQHMYTFPSEQSLMSIIVYGFTAFLIMRYINNRLISIIIIFITIGICVFAGLSPLFFQYQYPSDVVAGYVFGGVWLSLNIVLIEVFRILPSINNEKAY